MIFLSFSNCKGDSGFLSQHWSKPLPNPHPIENINPANCAGCHKSQYESFSKSLHAKTMESGILWQLPDMNHKARENCYSCHAPFPIQQENWNRIMDKISDSWKGEIEMGYKPSVSGTLDYYKGLTCATCHIRGENFFGPTLSGNVSKDYIGIRPHKLEIREEYEDEKFCISCHITPRDGKTINGKYLMDIYEDWKSTSYAKKGAGYKTCQSCHMPGREHSWKGIHDPDTVREAVKIDWDSSSHILTISNEGVGHMFPAYSVPRVEILVVDKNGKETFRKELGWKLDVFLEKEWEDTRIPAGQSMKIPIPREVKPKTPIYGKVQVFIHPGAHYRDSFRYTLENLELNHWERSELKKAISSVEDSRYLLWEENFGIHGSIQNRME